MHSKTMSSYVVLFAAVLLSVLFAEASRGQARTWTFAEEDLREFEPLLADLLKEGRPWQKVGGDYLQSAVSWPKERPARRGEPRDSWNAGVVILKYADETTAVSQWKRGNIGTNFINYQRREIEQAQASMDRHELGGKIDVEDDQIVDWTARYHPRVYNGRGPAPAKDRDRRYWVKVSLRVLTRYKNTIISAHAGRVLQIGGGDPIGSAVLRADPWALEKAARRLVDGKLGDRIEEEPEAEPETSDEVDTLYLEQRWYHGLLDAMARARREAALARMTLSVQRLAGKKLRHRIGQLRQILSGDSDDGIFDVSEVLVDWWDRTQERVAANQPEQALRRAIEKRIGELEAQVRDIESEQRAEVARIARIHEDIAYELDKKGKECERADVRAGVAMQRKALEAMREIGMLEMQLAAGHRREFDAKANELLRAGKYTADVRFMQALERLEGKDPRASLHALRLALKADPEHAMARHQARRIEQGYLERIDSEVMGEAASLRARCAERLAKGGEGDWWSEIKARLTLGIFSATAAIAGREAAVSDLTSLYLDDAAATHAGLMIIRRLHGEGVDLDYLQQIGNTEFIAAVHDKFGWDLDEAAARRMRASMKAAFRNPDVKRLTGDSREQLTADVGGSYYDVSEFDEGWMETIGDCVNIKNVVLMLGPTSVVKAGGKTAGIQYWGRWMGSARAPKDIVTLKDGFSSFIGLQKLADKMVRSRSGKVCADAILRWHKSTGAVSHILADALVQQGMIGTAQVVGDTVGLGPELAVLAEFFSAHGLGDVDVSVKLLKQAGVNAKQLRSVARSLAGAAQDLQSRGVPPRHLKSIRDTARTLGEGQAPTAAQMQSLNRTLREIDGQLTTLQDGFRRGKVGAVTLHQHQTLIATRRAAKQLTSGNLKAARASLELADEMEAIRNHFGSTVGRGKKAADAVEKSLSASGAGAAAGGTPGDTGLEGRLGSPGGATPTDLRRVDLDGKVHRRGVDGLLLRNEPSRAAKGYRKLLTYAESIDDGKLGGVRRELRRHVHFAEKVDEASRQLARARKVAGKKNAGALVAFSEAETSALERATDLEFVPIPGSKDEPYHVLRRAADGTIVERWVFKATSPETADAATIVYRMGRDLGIDVPAATGATMNIGGRPVKGTLIRYIDGQKLVECDIYRQFAVKKEMAQGRMLRTMLGDYDLQGKNVLIGRGGRRFQIDFDEADLTGKHLSGDPLRSMEEQILDQMDANVHVIQRNSRARRMAIYQVVDGIESHVTLEEIAPEIRRLQRTWTRAYMKRNFLQGVDSLDTERVLDMLEARRDGLMKVFRERYPSLPEHLTGQAGPRAPLAPPRLLPGEAPGRVRSRILAAAA